VIQESQPTQEVNYQLRRFDLNQLQRDVIVAIIGKRATGKTVLVKDILHHNRNFYNNAIVMSDTEPATGNYHNIVPEVCDFDTNVIETQINRQRNVVSSRGGRHSENVPHTAILLDDIICDDRWHRDRNIKRLFMNGRHYCISLIMTMQYPLGIPPPLRTNIDYVFILRENIVRNRKRIYDNYAGMFPSFEVFCRIMDSCTENYECLVINNTSRSNRIEDQVFWYKAEIHPEPFRVGIDDSWEQVEAESTE